MYKPTSFIISELAHPQIINDIGERNTWMRLDTMCLMDLQFIRDEWFEIHGSGIFINRLDFGLDSRGLRPPNDPDGSFYSLHKQGKAFDLDPVNGLYKDLYIFVIGLIKKGKLISINTLEDFKYTKKWVHISSMNHDKQLLIIKP